MTRTPKVLVVDDEEGIRFSLRKFLEDDGFNVDVASSFDEAEAAFSDKNYEVAVIDRILSGGHNGVDLVRFIHEHQPDCQTILISAYPTFESAAETLRLKTSAYLTKPICREDIIGAVREAVRRSKIKKESGHNKFLFNSLVEYSPYAIVVYDMSGRVVAVNPAYTHLFGFREGETIGRRVSFLPEMSLEEMDALFAEFIWGETMRVWETKTTTPDGKTLDLSVTLLQIRDNQGELIYIIAGLFDNTKIKRTEKEYRHIQRVATIGALAGGIAHDFNNILTPIIGHVEMVYKKTGADSSIGQNLDQVLRACERAKDLIRQITDFSRMSGKERQPIELSLIVKEVLNLIRASIPATIDIRANIAATKTAVLADPAQIHEVLINLCTNAAQAMNETGGVLEVTLTEADIDSGVSSQGLDPFPESYLRLTVSDTGPGMAQDVRERIFDSYFTTKEENGTGLGLPIVQGIVTSHGGEILVFSEEGKGTSFEVLLPRTASEVTARKDQLTILPAGSERILVVDDEKAVVDVWLYMLNEFGYEVVTNTSSLEALNVFQTQPDNFDIVITDHTMPDMTGVELTREIKNIRPDIPIIMCTGCDNLITPEEAMEIGISEVVTKPIGSGLACVIRRVLDSAGRE